ncbi:hypothetical protein D3H64_05315 [Atopobacter sp. AH10]|uniref:exonuclease domain-containing protein n=1 Tax=Atopobacter sp. AH10 TaxID=2315861 RepID=UPI000EF1FCB1|nr:exonuclease domain-containing protein [Atopobacter sp. AH10]RLK63204.1 hypothetical protein D3H64_05315 [Atopobacter sp. AH10]
MDVIIDLETTGPDYDKGDRIIQIGCVFIDNEKIVDELSTYVNPQRSIPLEITELTGISQEDVKNAPYFEELGASLSKVLAGCRVIAHNANFDVSFLKKSFASLGFTDFNPEILDTVELSQILFPDLRRYKLELLAQDLGLGDFLAHSAIEDARVTAQIYLLCRKEIAKLPRIVLNELIRLGAKKDLSSVKLFKELVQTSQALADRVDLVRLFPHVVAQKALDNGKDNLTIDDYFSQPSLKKYLEDHFRLAQIDQPLYQLAFREETFLDTADLNEHNIYSYTLELLPKGLPVTVIASRQDQLTAFLLYLKRKKVNASVAILNAPESYVDLYKVEQILSSTVDFTRLEIVALMGLVVWLTKTKTGDMSGLYRLSTLKHLAQSICCHLQEKVSSSCFWSLASKASHQQAILMTQVTYYRLGQEMPPYLLERWLVGWGMDQAGKLIREAVRRIASHHGEGLWPFAEVGKATGSLMQLAQALPDNKIATSLRCDSRIRYHIDYENQTIYMVPIPMRGYLQDWLHNHVYQPMTFFFNGIDAFNEWEAYQGNIFPLDIAKKREIAVWAKKDTISENERVKYLAEELVEWRKEDSNSSILVICHSYDFLWELYDKIRKLGQEGVMSQSISKKDVLIRQIAKGNSGKIVLMTLNTFEANAHLLPEFDRSVLTKLPFESIDSPIQLMAKDYYQSRAKDYFASFQVPSMIKHLESFVRYAGQICGSKKGIVLFDPRLLQQSYGQTVQNSLSPFAEFYQLDGGKKH